MSKEPKHVLVECKIAAPKVWSEKNCIIVYIYIERDADEIGAAPVTNGSAINKICKLSGSGYMLVMWLTMFRGVCIV